MQNKIVIDGVEESFAEMLPRSIFAEANIENVKEASSFTGIPGFTGAMSNAAMLSGVPNILRNPSRRFYDPELTTTAIYLPRNIKQKNRWRRWFYNHDELLGAVLDLHAELPYSRAELMVDDKIIKRHYDECLDMTNFFSMLPIIDLEYMKIGEVILNTPWDSSRGMWSHIILHNPDYVEVRFSPFADKDSVIELIPDDELKNLIHSTKPEDQQLKKRLPSEIVKRVVGGKNIILNPEETTHIARRSNPYDVRGTSIIDRIFRCFVPETLVRMSDGTCKEIKDVVVGDEVLSLNGEKRKVLDTVKYEIKNKIIEIVPEKSEETLKCTVGHKFLIQKALCACGCGGELSYRQVIKQSNFLHGHNLKINSSLNENCKDTSTIEPIYKIEETESQNIKEGNRLLVPINNEVGECNLTEGQARLLGYFIAEGSFCNENTGYTQYIEFTFGLHEQETWAKDVIEILEKDFNITPYVFPGYNEKKVFVIRVVKQEYYKKLSDFLNDNLIGRRAWTKELKEKVLYYPKNIQFQILIGACRGDGTYNRNYSEMMYCTTSQKLAQQFQWLFFRCAYYNYIKEYNPKPKMICSNTHISILKKYYHVRITGNYSKRFIKECWNDFKVIKPTNKKLFLLIKQLKEEDYSFTEIAKILSGRGYKGIEGGKFYNNTVKNIFDNGGSVGKQYQFSRDHIRNDENYFYVPVKKINEVKYKGTVHDITVDVNHWWLVNGCHVTSNTLLYEDKLRESQITVADNFIYPLKIFKLGDPQRGWIPNESHQRALAQMLQQATFDPNFALIYHYGLQVDYVTVADKILRLDKEWPAIDNKKMIALGVSQQFMTGESTFASANVGLQTQMARYRAKRDLFEVRWMMDKFFRVMAKRNEYYRRDKREITNQFRVARHGLALEERLILPKLVWHKKLMMRDDQAFLTYLNNVYAQGKGPISALTLLMSMGLDLEDELRKKKDQKDLEKQIGEFIQPPMPGAPVPGGLPGGAPGGAPGLPGMAGGTPPPIPGGPKPPVPAAPAGDIGAKASWQQKLKDFLKFGKPEDIKKVTAQYETLPPEIQEIITESQTEFTGSDSTGSDRRAYLASEQVINKEIASDIDVITNHIPSSDEVWRINTASYNIPAEVSTLLLSLDQKLSSLDKKYAGDMFSGVIEEIEDITKLYIELYVQGKFASYNWSGFFPIYKNVYSQTSELRDYSDIILTNQFEDWIYMIKTAVSSSDLFRRHIRNLGTVCFAQGQLKGLQEQGIHTVRLSNTLINDGLRYSSQDLLKKGMTLLPSITKNDDVVLFVPCIEGFDDEQFGNTLDPHIMRYKDLLVSDISVKACPIEYAPFMEKFLSRVGKYLNTRYNQIVFTSDVIDLEEWGVSQKEALLKEFGRDSKGASLVNSKLEYDGIQKRGKIASFESEKTLYISNWIGMEDAPFIDSLTRAIDIISPDLTKAINKNFKQANYDLTSTELETYVFFKYIESITAVDTGSTRGYRVSSIKNSSVPLKVVKGKIWNVEGKCLGNFSASPIQTFRENLRLWVEYPFLLDEELVSFFSTL